jgi:salicylate hydroxylase
LQGTSKTNAALSKMAAMSDEPFVITGGGIAGLACAVGLARIGRRAIVLERAAAFEEAGAGLQLGPNAVKALKYLGAWEAIAPYSFSPSAIVVRDGLSGETLQEIDLGTGFEGRFGEPYRVIHRADLLAGLLTVAEASNLISLSVSTHLTGLVQRPDNVIAQTDSGASLIGCALIGADGVRSRVRHEILGDGPPRFAGQVLFRALLPISSAPPGLRDSAVSLWLCRGGHVVHYPVGAGKSLNIVAVAKGSSREESWSAAADASEVVGLFHGHSQPIDRVLSAPPRWTKWAGVWRPTAPRWSQRRVTLIGDAAHPMLPYLAQGAAMAIEDAAVLSAVLASGRDIAGAFSAYERQRLSRTSRTARSSRRQALVYHATGPLRLFRNAWLRYLTPGDFLSRMAWLYGWEPPRS